MRGKGADLVVAEPCEESPDDIEASDRALPTQRRGAHTAQQVAAKAAGRGRHAGGVEFNAGTGLTPAHICAGTDWARAHSFIRAHSCHSGHGQACHLAAARGPRGALATAEGDHPLVISL